MVTEKRRIQAIFFDLGYTLIYFSGNFKQIICDSYYVLADELIKAGCRIDREEFVKRFNEKMKQYYQQRQVDFLERPVEAIIKSILDEMNQNKFSDDMYLHAMYAMYRTTEKFWLIENDTHATLQKLLDQGYRLAIISNASNAWDVNNLIDNHKLRQYFSTILISANEGIRKPDPRIFQRAAEKLEIDPSEVVMVGDMLEADVLGAHRAGMRAVWISRRKEKPVNPDTLNADMKPDAEIHALDELPDLLNHWNELALP